MVCFSSVCSGTRGQQRKSPADLLSQDVFFYLSWGVNTVGAHPLFVLLSFLFYFLFTCHGAGVNTVGAHPSGSFFPASGENKKKRPLSKSNSSFVCVCVRVCMCVCVCVCQCVQIYVWMCHTTRVGAEIRTWYKLALNVNELFPQPNLRD